jgi:hypothetical protein
MTWPRVDRSVALNQDEGKPVISPDLGLASDSQRTNAAHWVRFRRLMAWMLVFSVACVAAAIFWLKSQGVVLHLHFMIAMGLGISLSLMLAAGLMGLVFVSSRIGIDDAVIDLPPPDVGEER